MNFNEKMIYLRKKKGVSQERASKKIGISVSSLRNYECDRIAETETLRKIQQYYNVPFEYLLNDNCINEEYNNIDIGETLKLSDTSINNIKSVNSNTKNNVIDNFISNISENDFWKKLDECIKLQTELKELEPLKELEKYKKHFKKYISNKSISDYEIIEDENSFYYDYESYYKENSCTYKTEDKNIILKCLDIVFNNKIIKELDFIYLLNKYDEFIDLIKKCINKGAKIPSESVKSFFDIPTNEIKERTDRLEILGFYISNELVRYIKNI